VSTMATESEPGFIDLRDLVVCAMTFMEWRRPGWRRWKWNSYKGHQYWRFE
jgi:hypothetical protein